MRLILCMLPAILELLSCVLPATITYCVRLLSSPQVIETNILRIVHALPAWRPCRNEG